jgi:hypothetical protein
MDIDYAQRSRGTVGDVCFRYDLQLLMRRVVKHSWCERVHLVAGDELSGSLRAIRYRPPMTSRLPATASDPGS